MALARELEAALGAAAVAGAFIRAEYESFVPIPNAPGNISTHVDKGSQELILQYLRERFPEDGLCAEEATATLAESQHDCERVWVVDPIDGTRGFAMKNGEFTVMIGLTIRKQVVLGVVLEPTRGTYTFATKGGGCFTASGDDFANRTPCRVTATARLADATIAMSHIAPKGKLVHAVDAVRPTRVLEMYSAGLKLASVAQGAADAYVNTYHRFHDWDICAGDILVTEAGGTVTGFRGEPVVYGRPSYRQNDGLLASNGTMHADLVATLAGCELG